MLRLSCRRDGNSGEPSISGPTFRSTRRSHRNMGSSPGCETTSRDDGKTSRQEQLHSRRARKTIIRHQRYELGESSSCSRICTFDVTNRKSKLNTMQSWRLYTIQKPSRHIQKSAWRRTATSGLSALVGTKCREVPKVPTSAETSRRG